MGGIEGRGVIRPGDEGGEGGRRGEEKRPAYQLDK